MKDEVEDMVFSDHTKQTILSDTIKNLQPIGQGGMQASRQFLIDTRALVELSQEAAREHGEIKDHT